MATKTFEIDWIDLKEYEGLYKISTDGQGNICNCCNGIRKTAYKFKWMYK